VTTQAPARPTSAASPALPLAAAGVTLVLWASAFVAIRHLGHDVPPGALSLARLLIGAAVLGAFVVRRPRTWPARRDWPLLLLCGISWFGIYNVTLNASERRIDAGTSALVVQVGPIIIALLATFFLGERMTTWLLVGMGVGFVGVVVIGRGSSSGHGDLLGVVLAIVAAVTYAIGVLAQKPLVGRLPGLEITFLACVIGAVTCLPYSAQLVHAVGDASVSDLLWMAYLGVFPTAIGFSTWAFALKHSDAGKLALTTFLVPFIATGLAWALLDEVPPGLAFVGGALCIAGVLITRKKPRSVAATPAPAVPVAPGQPQH
jgi:drug/metabolite transporter (DMT)-like permease